MHASIMHDYGGIHASVHAAELIQIWPQSVLNIECRIAGGMLYRKGSLRGRYLALMFIAAVIREGISVSYILGATRRID